MLSEIKKTLIYEGGFSDHKNDSGGATFAGLSLSYMLQAGDRDKNGTLDFDLNRDGKVDAADVKLLTVDAVADELTREFYYKLNLVDLRSIRLRWKVCDIAINCGRTVAVKMLQRAMNVDDDGVIGLVTRQRANTLIQSGIGETALLTRLSNNQVRHYVACVKRDAKNLSFIDGWLTRAFDLGDDL